MSLIHPTAKIYPNVRLGAGVRVGPWAVVGLPAPGMLPGEWETIVGENAVIRSHSVLYAGARIGPNFQTGHRAIIGPAMQIGAGCSVGAISVVKGFAELRDGARVHGHCYVGEFTSCGKKAWVGPNCLVESSLDRITHVGAGAILGLRVHLRPGTRVGERALVGTRCLIRDDVKPYRVMVGNPPRAIRTIDTIKSRVEADASLYELDTPETLEAVLEQHDRRPESRLAADNWRLAAWQELAQRRGAVRHSEPLAIPGETLPLDNLVALEQ